MTQQIRAKVPSEAISLAERNSRAWAIRQRPSKTAPFRLGSFHQLVTGNGENHNSPRPPARQAEHLSRDLNITKRHNGARAPVLMKAARGLPRILSRGGWNHPWRRWSAVASAS